MNLRVGPFIYRVQQVEGYIVFEGEDCLGLCDNEQHVLLVSDKCSQSQQVQVICHEYMEAWVYHFGQLVQDKEGWCDLFGLAMTQFVLDLMHTLRLEGAAVLASPDAVSGMPTQAPLPPPIPTPTPKAEKTIAPPSPPMARKRSGPALWPIRLRDQDRLPPLTPAQEQAWKQRILETLQCGLSRGPQSRAND